MKWLKLFADTHRGRTVQMLLDKHGHAGVVLYYSVLQMCTEKIDRLKDRPLTESDMVVSFNRHTLLSTSRTTWHKAQTILDTCRDCLAFDYEISGKEIKIKIPMLLNLLDRDVKKLRTNAAQVADKCRLELELELEKELDTTKVVYVTPMNNSESAPIQQVGSNAPAKNTFVNFTTKEKLVESLPANSLNRWHEIYQDKEFIEREITKAFGYYENNKKKAPKSLKGWVNALSSWLERSWVYRGKHQQPSASGFISPNSPEYWSTLKEKVKA